MTEKTVNQNPVMVELEKEKRDALFQLDQDVRDEVLRFEFYIPFIKLLAIEGAKQSPLTPQANERNKIYRHGDKLFKVFFYEEMLLDRNIQLNAQSEYSILKLATTKGIQNLCHIKGVYLGFSHLAYELEQYEMTFRTYLEELRDVK